MPSHNGSQQELEIRSVRKKMGLCDKVNELNLSALCKKKRKKKQEQRKLNYILNLVPNFQKQTNETLFT